MTKLGYLIVLFREATSCFWKQGRIKTFDKWPFKDSDKCNVKSMAAAGFFFIGNDNDPDLVECFICGKQLDGWEQEDDPWYVVRASYVIFVIIFV